MLDSGNLCQGNIVAKYFTTNANIRIPAETYFKVVEVHAFKIKVVKHDEIPACVEHWTEIDCKDICLVWLTTKILQRCNLKKSDNYENIWNNGKVGILFLSDGDCEFRGFKFSYLHELQNIYELFTKEKLEFK